MKSNARNKLSAKLRQRQKRRSLISRRRSELELLEQRELLTVSTFQNGVGGYNGQGETVLFSREPGANFGGESSMSPDQQDANGVRQGLLRFDNIVGRGAIPLGARINSATFVVNVVNDSNSAMQMSLYRMQVPWEENSATWKSFGTIGGIQASEGEASSLPPDGILFEADTTAAAGNNDPPAGTFDVTRSLEYWVTGAENNGWLMESAATNGWDYSTSEAAPATIRPKLTVDWDVPASDEFKILSQSLVAEEGSTVQIGVARFGNLAGPASVAWEIGADTAGADDFMTASGTIEFEAGQAFATIDLVTVEDDALEGDETVTVTLTGDGVLGDPTSVKIGDDDALINEILANISNTDVDETDKEYIELIGTPGASLEGYQFVVFEGEEEEGGGTDGAGLGVADFVFDLSGQSFGSNGLLVIAPTNWAYADLAAEGTNIVNTDQLDNADGGGVLEDFSQTYALVRGNLTQGTDYDTVGAYEDDTNQAIGEGVGILELPAGTQLIDSVGTVEGGGGDRDRVLTTPELNHPGVHVHQPQRNRDVSPNGVTADGITRRLGESQPNTIGVWYNGDILDGSVDGTLEYANDTFWTSVVTPDGAVITPGAPNQLRTVQFSLDSQAASAAEADGTVELTLTRVGAADEEVTVEYSTFSVGSATPDIDFTSVSDSVTFPAGVNSQTVNIPLLGDSAAEGFETFGVEITSATGGYLITNGKPTEFGEINGEAIVTIVDGDVQVGTFQDDDDNGYEGTLDAHLDGELVDDKFSSDLVVRVDNNKGEFGDEVQRPQQGMLQFDEVFGDGSNQVPAGSTIFSGFVTLNIVDGSGGDVSFYRMLQPWDDVQASWSNPQGDAGEGIVDGIVPDDVEAVAVPDAVVPDASRTGKVQIPLNKDTLQSWANGSLDNYGWTIVNDSGELWGFSSKESFDLDGQGLSNKPELTVVYNPPASGSAGNFSFSQDEYVVTEGGTATITVNRIGGSSGAVSVDWSVGDGGGSDDIGTTTGTLSFAAGELFKTFTIATTNDSDIETNEEFTLSLSGADLLDGESTLVVRDNDYDVASGDLLLNEMFINSPGNDPPHEFIEIAGTPGIGLGSMYYVAVEGSAGEGDGLAEKIVDLGAYSNGDNGITVITPQADQFAYNVVPEATQIDALGTTAQENVSSQNDSTTYMLIYSPEQRISSYDFDWDNDGTLDLPASAQIIDVIGVDVSESATDTTYGDEKLSRGDVDALSRLAGDNRADEVDAWYGGDLFPAGDDYLYYEPGSDSFKLPLTGAAMSPGQPNTASDAAQISVVSVDVSDAGTVTVTFSGIVDQVNVGDSSMASPGGAGITITATDGSILATVDTIPSVSGLGTDRLTLSFSGSSVSGGVLAAGEYRLNFVGNGILANGRVADPAGDGSQFNGFATANITVPEVTGGGLVGDINNDGSVNFPDFLALSGSFNQSVDAGTGADLNDDGEVNFADFLVLSMNFGNTAAAAAAATDAAMADLFG